ncbi:MAG: hypothetical protein H0V83_14045 [Rubrobacter sp.]|nr:hypothetical protein [Rubrobacter sp.]
MADSFETIVVGGALKDRMLFWREERGEIVERIHTVVSRVDLDWRRTRILGG